MSFTRADDLLGAWRLESASLRVKKCEDAGRRRKVIVSELRRGAEVMDAAIQLTASAARQRKARSNGEAAR